MEVSQLIMIINSIITCGDNKFLIFYPSYIFLGYQPLQKKTETLVSGITC